MTGSAFKRWTLLFHIINSKGRGPGRGGKLSDLTGGPADLFFSVLEDA